MKNYVIVALTDSPQGPQVAQEGQLMHQVGEFFAVDFFRPSHHTRILNVSELRPFHFFSSREQLVAFLSKICPPATEVQNVAVVEDVVPGTNTPSA
jgi:hypothetical protein